MGGAAGSGRGLARGGLRKALFVLGSPRRGVAWVSAPRALRSEASSPGGSETPDSPARCPHSASDDLSRECAVRELSIAFRLSGFPFLKLRPLDFHVTHTLFRLNVSSDYNHKSESTSHAGIWKRRGNEGAWPVSPPPTRGPRKRFLLSSFGGMDVLQQRGRLVRG